MPAAAAEPQQYGESSGGYEYDNSYPEKKQDYPHHHEHKKEVCSCVGYPGQDGSPGRDGKDGEDGSPGKREGHPLAAAVYTQSLFMPLKQRSICKT
jgi:hypothetical protein